MSKFALYVPLEAKPGKEKKVADFLRSAVPLVNAEAGTISWFAIQMVVVLRDFRHIRHRSRARRPSQRRGSGRVNGKSEGR